MPMKHLARGGFHWAFLTDIYLSGTEIGTLGLTIDSPNVEK